METTEFIGFNRASSQSATHLQENLMKHTERELLEYVAKFLETRVTHQAEFWEIRNHIERSFPLNEDDLRPTPSGSPAWHRTLLNLKCHKTILKKYPMIKAIPNGFMLTTWKV